MHIRLAVPADVPRIFDIRTSVHDNHLGLDALAELGITPAAVLEQIEHNANTWVAELEARVQGFAMVDAAEGWLFALFVDPLCAGQGIGSTLLSIAESSLFQHHQCIRLETAVNSPAARFYMRRGWVRSNTAPAKSAPEDAIFTKNAPIPPFAGA
ncbi:GNAT family N-acetyltransferase [Lampropedia puyangensis]|uniref:GNAT family N-acetyltransferase n=1 Tax=Lampropedia puyangensis TaxID=1330072 RepID=A0A4S8EVA8_9BURK|nr:GNAT family N-acetyltransferase [Lampropedia puyangensis]